MKANTEIDWSRLDGIASDLAFLKARIERLDREIARHEAAIIRMQATLNRPSWFKRLFLAKWWN